MHSETARCSAALPSKRNPTRQAEIASDIAEATIVWLGLLRCLSSRAYSGTQALAVTAAEDCRSCFPWLHSRRADPS